MARRIRVQVDEHWYIVEVDDIRANPVSVLIDGESVEVEVEGLPAGEIPGVRSPAASAGTPAGPVTVVQAPMPGVILSVAVTVSQRVSAGDQLCVLEAIKLEQSIRAPVPGVVRAVHVQPGQSVTAGEAMLELG